MKDSDEQALRDNALAQGVSPRDPVLGVLTGQVPVRSAPIAMKPTDEPDEPDEPDEDEGGSE